jgi:hypothetical protein
MADHDTPEGGARDGGAPVVDLRILTRGISSEEAAAVTAVLVAAAGEEAVAHAMIEEPVHHEWASRRRALRAPLEVGPGRWTHSVR